jgi:hypothetical protein
LSWKAPTNGSTGWTKGSRDMTRDWPAKKKDSQSSNGPTEDPLEKARTRLDSAHEANNLLMEADDFDEETGKHEVTVNLHNATPAQPSSPQIEVSQPEPGVFRIAYTAVSQLRGWPLAFVLLAVVAAYVVLKLKHAL